jgi:DNA-directed RNA polymerase specialized sigma24 family protein
MSQLSWPGHKVPDSEGIEAVLRDLHEPLRRMAAYVYRQASAEVRGAVGVDDLVQEAMIASWCELKAPDGTRLHSPKELRNYIFGLLRKQVAKAAGKRERYTRLLNDLAASFRSKGTRYTPLTPSERAASSQKEGKRYTPLPSSHSVLDELIASRDGRLLAEAVCGLEAMVERGDKVLRQALARLSPAEAGGVDAWLLGAGYRKAGKPHGLSLAQMRSAVHKLRSGFVDYFVSRIRCELKALYDISPSAAARIQLGRLRRLVLDPKTGRHTRSDHVEQAHTRSLVEYRNGRHAENNHAA